MKKTPTETDYLRAIMVMVHDIRRILLGPKCFNCGSAVDVVRSKDGIPLCRACRGEKE